MSELPRDSVGVTVEEQRLAEMKRWLTLGKSSVAVVGLSLVLPLGIVSILLTWAAILFSPYLIVRLLQLKRFGWIAALVIFVVAPLLINMLSDFEGITGFILSVFPLLVFYTYTWLLGHSVAGWLDELTWKRHYHNASAQRLV